MLLCVGAAVGASVWYYGKRKASASFLIAASRASVRLKNVNRNPAFAKDSAYAPANDGSVEKETTPAPGDDLFSDDGGRAAVSNATYEHGPAPIRGASLRRVQGVKANPSYMDTPAAAAAAADDDDVYQNDTMATDTGAQSPGGVDDDVHQNGAVDGQHAASPNVDHAGHRISTAAPLSSAAAVPVLAPALPSWAVVQARATLIENTEHGVPYILLEACRSAGGRGQWWACGLGWGRLRPWIAPGRHPRRHFFFPPGLAVQKSNCQRGRR